MPQAEVSSLAGGNDDAQPIPACPHCLKPDTVIRNGFRSLKSGPVQIFLCKDCNKQFRGRKMKNVSYAPGILLAAVSHFNTGYTYEKTVMIMKEQHQISLPISTLKSWIDRYTDDFPFIKHRKSYNLKPQNVIMTRRFTTPDPRFPWYDFKVHTLKVRLAGKKLPGLSAYLTQALTEPNDHLFRSEETRRISELARHVPTPKGTVRIVPNTETCRLTTLALELCQTQNERHSKIEEFFLINDLVTLAVEVPVWLSPEEAWRLGLPGLTITGYVDMLQVVNDQCYILDYNPDPITKEYAMTLLDIYAKALSVRAKIPLRNIHPVYFDDKKYIEIDMKKGRQV